MWKDELAKVTTVSRACISAHPVLRSTVRIIRPMRVGSFFCEPLSCGWLDSLFFPFVRVGELRMAADEWSCVQKSSSRDSRKQTA